MKKIVAALALVALIGYGWRLFQQMGTLDQRVAAAERSNQALEETVNLVREQAERSLDAIEAAEQFELQTRLQAADEANRATEAYQDRAAAEGAQRRALETLAASQAAVEDAALAAARQRRERRAEWQRLGSALRKIAPTETGAARHQVDLTTLRQAADGVFDERSRETLSRLTGVLLANYGYTVRLNGTASPAIRDYFSAAGVPGDALSLQADQGPNRLDVLETVLAHP